MPTTVRIVASVTDPEAGTEGNLDFVQTKDSGRVERWSVFGGADWLRFYWPLEGELTLFLQVWQPQPATNETALSIRYPGIEGWTFKVPIVGRVTAMFPKPATTDIIELLADPYSVEISALYF